MTKISVQEIAGVISEKHGLSQQEAETFVTAFFDLINDGLHDDKIVKVKGFGTFKVVDVRDRESVNVNTGERVVIEGHGKISFTPDPIMRDLVNKPFAQFETVILNDGVEIEELNKVPTPELSEDDIVLDEDENVGNDIEISENENIVTENFTEEEIEVPSPDNDLQNENVLSVNDETEISELLEEKDVEDVSPNVDDEVKSDIVPETPDKDFIQGGTSDDSQETALQQDKSVDEDNDNNIKNEPNVIVNEEKSVPDTEVENSENESIVASDETNNEEADEETAETDEDSFISRNKRLILVLSAFVIAAVFFVAGYYVCRMTTEPQIKYVKVAVVKKQVAKPIVADSIQKKDTTKTKLNTTTENPDTVSNKKVSEIVKTETPVTVETKPIATDAVLRDARARVNTGAYRIIGTETTVTVKKGEDIKKISKFYLGDGMECYFQVHNGISEVKEGMKLRVPKLEHKKKRK